MKFHIYKDRFGGWRWRLVGRNGEIVAQGESYTRKSSVRRAIGRIKLGAQLAGVVDEQ